MILSNVELEIVGKGSDINDRPYVILQPTKMPVKRGKPKIIQLVIYYNEKQEIFEWYATVPVLENERQKTDKTDPTKSS